MKSEIYIDQLSRKVSIKNFPQRIISLVPSQTELLFDLGLEKEVIGITKFCVHPNAWFRNKERIGGTKKINFEKIKALQPDLIIGNKEENQKDQIEELMKHYPVWMSDIKNLDDALEMITSVGEITNTKEKANPIASEIKNRFEKFSLLTSHFSLSETAYFIWKKPYMVAGSGTFIDSMLQQCGFKNVFEKTRYPEINEEQIRAANPQLILLSSEPYPFKEKDVEEFKKICPDAKVLIVDGEIFSWYGSRLLHAPAYFEALLKSL